MSSSRAEVVARVADLLVRVPVGHPLRVAIDGITGAGKTTFARDLGDAVSARGRPCVNVTMDGFHNPRAVRYRQGRESADGYYEDAYDFAALRTVLLDPLGPRGDGGYRTAVLDLARDEPVDAPMHRAPAGLVVIVDGSFLQRRDLGDVWDVVVFLRSSFETARVRGAARDAEHFGSAAEALRIFDVRYHAAQRRYLDEADPEARAEIVIEHDDPRNPTVARVAAELTAVQPHLRRTRAFFGPRAATWDERFPDDDAAFASAIVDLAPRTGGVVVDLGCGTGRALAHLRTAVGADGVVVGVDVTEEMLRTARAAGDRDARASLVLADATGLPFAPRSVDGIFAAGLVTHVPDPEALLRALAEVARADGRLAIFHPIGRAALARRHGRTLRPDELLDPSVLPGVLAANGWEPERVDDAEHRYLALARVAR